MSESVANSVANNETVLDSSDDTNAATTEMTPEMARRTALWRVAIFAVLIGFIAVIAYSLVRQNVSSSRPTGQAPDFTFTTFEGETIRLSDLRGKGVVLNFWASWCIPCRNEAPILEEAWLREKENGIIFLGLDYLDQDHVAKAFLEEFKVTYPNGPDLQSEAARSYGLTGVPETYFIDPNGEITGMKLAELTSMAELDSFLAKIRPQ